MVYFAFASQKLPLRTYLLPLYGGGTPGAWYFQRALAGRKKNFKMPSMGR